ncbi:MAG: hypothetical protein P8188_05760 [Gemmatimonadota bacterium]
MSRHGVPRRGWSSMVVERLSLPPLILMAAVLSASVQLVAVGQVRLGPLLVTVVGITALLALLRLMDDVKDLDRDRIAHPDRPLARGALSRHQARQGVITGLAVVLTGAGVLTVAGPSLAGAFLALCGLWAFLMYREFFFPERLRERPVLYALTHQAVVLPLYGFAAATVGSGAAGVPEVWWFAATGLGASFTWEVCRKLDPDADPVLDTYRARLGPARTVALATGSLALVAVPASRLGLAPILWPMAGLVLAALLFAWARPGSYRAAAGAAGLLAAIQPAAPLLGRLWGAA